MMISRGFFKLFTILLAGFALVATATAPVSAQEQDVQYLSIDSVPVPPNAFFNGSGLSGDGNWVASIGWSEENGGVLRLENWRTGAVREKDNFEAFDVLLNSERISYDGTYVVATVGQEIVVINTKTWATVTMDETDVPYNPMISPNGAYVLATQSNKIYNGTTGALIKELPAQVFAIGFTDDNQLISYGDESGADLQVDTRMYPSIDIYNPTSGAKTASYAGTSEMCAAGIGNCNVALAQNYFGFGSYTGDHYGYLFLQLDELSSDDGKIMAIGDDAEGVTHIFNVDYGYEVANATTIWEIFQAYDYGPNEAAVMRLYQAFFARTPDVNGVKYWISILKAGTSLEDIALFMSDSQEFRNFYEGTTNAEYVAAVYSNVLGRDYDQSGYQYWLGLLDGGELNRSGIVHWITANPEFIKSFPFMI